MPARSGGNPARAWSARIRRGADGRCSGGAPAARIRLAHSAAGSGYWERPRGFSETRRTAADRKRRHAGSGSTTTRRPGRGCGRSGISYCHSSCAASATSVTFMIKVTRPRVAFKRKVTGCRATDEARRSAPPRPQTLIEGVCPYGCRARRHSPQERLEGFPRNLCHPQPFGGDRLRPLVAHEFSATRLFLGADRSRVLSELGTHRHRLLDGRALADLLQPAFDVGELTDVDLSV